jgi:biotin transport system substrate-specific component
MEQNQSIALGNIDATRTSVQIFRIALFAAVTAAAAQVEIPHQPIPFTLQTFAVLLSGAMLGARNGALSQLLYLAFGLLGLPVYAQFGSGVLHIVGPTGGYLLAFPIAAFVVGYLYSNRSYLRSVISMLIGLLIIFSLGTIQLYVVYYHNLSTAISNGFLIFTWWDGVKLVGAAGIAKTAGPYFSRK